MQSNMWGNISFNFANNPYFIRFLSKLTLTLTLGRIFFVLLNLSTIDTLHSVCTAIKLYRGACISCENTSQINATLYLLKTEQRLLGP